MKRDVTHHYLASSYYMRGGNTKKQQRSHDIGLIWHHQTYTFKETPEINDTA